MSLVRTPWIVIGGAGLLAVFLPARLLSGGMEPVHLAPLPAPTSVDFADVAPLSYALTAPPFTSGRVPPPDEPASDAEAGQPPEPPSPPPALVGTIVAPRGRAVALARGASGETLTLSRGDGIDGWILTAVGRDHATFARDGTEHIAQLDFANRTEAPATAPPAIVPASSQPASQADTPPLQSNRNR